MSRAAWTLAIALVLVPAALIIGGWVHSDAPTGRGVKGLGHPSVPLAPSVRLSGEPRSDEPLQLPEPWWSGVVAVFADHEEPVSSEPRALSYIEWRNTTDRPCSVYEGLQLTPERALELVAKRLEV